ncbi:MAG: response regulator [Candidatus Altiarchaeota archaeon]|nr:response regulator [Candidatus Altiarchaeota archaeon]
MLKHTLQTDKLFSESKESELGVNVSVDFTSVGDGVEALDYLTSSGKYYGVPHKKPDLILLDLNLPRKNGLTTLGEIKSNPDLKSIPVIVLAGINNTKNIDKAFELGASNFVCKPIDTKRFVKSIAQIGILH